MAQAGHVRAAGGRTDNLGTRIWPRSRVLGQRRLFEMVSRAYGALFTMGASSSCSPSISRLYGLLFEERFHIGHRPVDALGFLQDFFATTVFLGITTFAIVQPREIGRSSRFYGSRRRRAWLVLLMIFNVIWTYVLVRGSAVNNGTLPYGNGGLPIAAIRQFFAPSGSPPTIIETTAPCCIEVMLAFLILVLHSGACIFLAPLTSRSNGCRMGWARCCRSKPMANQSTSRIPAEMPYSAAARSRLHLEGDADFATCTECGRCQSQCPAWNFRQTVVT